MSERLSDANIDELLEELDAGESLAAMRAIVRAWLPACPKRVRVTQAKPSFWYANCIGEVFDVECLAIDPDGERLIYVGHDWRPRAIRLEDCEPVSDEGGEG